MSGKPAWVGKVPITHALRAALRARRDEGRTWEQVADGLPISGARCRQIVIGEGYTTAPEVYEALGMRVPRATHEQHVVIYISDQLPAEAVEMHLPYLERRVSYCEECGRPFIWRAPPRGGRPWHRRCDRCAGREVRKP